MGFFGGGGASASNMVGATSSAAGTAGLVPAPAAGDENRQLLGSATFIQTSPYILSGRTTSIFTFHSVNSFACYSANNVTLNASQIWFSPILVNCSFIFDRILFANRNGNALANTKFGLYTHDRTSGVPKTLLVQSANVASISGITNNEATVDSTTLSPDIYWACFVSANSALTRRIEETGSAIRQMSYFIGGNDSANLAGWGSDSAAGLAPIKYSLTYTGTESLPSSLTASSVVIDRTIHAPWMGIRRS